MSAQEGYPLDGTWRGEWGPADGQRTPVVIVMKWDGDNISGQINPGPASLPFDQASLDPSNWTVHIEAATADGTAITIDGSLGDIGSYNRWIEGTWDQGGTEHPFKITRE